MWVRLPALTGKMLLNICQCPFTRLKGIIELKMTKTRLYNEPVSFNTISMVLNGAYLLSSADLILSQYFADNHGTLSHEIDTWKWQDRHMKVLIGFVFDSICNIYQNFVNKKCRLVVTWLNHRINSMWVHGWVCKKLTWFSAKIVERPAIDPIAFGIHVLVKIGLNNSWSWSGQMAVVSFALPSMNRYWRVLRKLKALFGLTFGIFESDSSMRLICTGGKTIIWFHGTNTVRVIGRKGARWNCNVIAPPPFTKMSNLLMSAKIN